MARCYGSLACRLMTGNVYFFWLGLKADSKYAHGFPTLPSFAREDV